MELSFEKHISVALIAEIVNVTEVELVCVAPLLMLMVPDVCAFICGSWLHAIRDMVNINANANKIFERFIGLKFIFLPSASKPPLINIRFYQN